MKTVPLIGKHGAGRVAIVDDEDYELVNAYTWRVWLKLEPGRRPNGPYAVTTVGHWTRPRQLQMHKLITGGSLTDHINHDGLDNRRANLRIATRSQNNANCRPTANGSSRYKGLCWRPRYHKWQVAVAGTYIGMFADEEAGARAYDAAALALFGEFAYLNFPERAS